MSIIKKYFSNVMGQLTAAMGAFSFIIYLFVCDKNTITVSLTVGMVGIFVLSYIFSVLEIVDLFTASVFVNMYHALTNALGFGVCLFWLVHSNNVLSFVVNFIFMLLFAVSCINFLRRYYLALSAKETKNHV